ncbi:hypothetical protein [Pseudoduganella violaceinigra]|uniref:hypothetical protein n=1 Tax=Pseudoduganella violaceinigra TaxID=246602 RepID=UPI00040B71BD|nr:hypothetical protein [Pseudoduganella violaceinigra]
MEKKSVYTAYRALQEEFAQSVGYPGKREIPEALVRKLADLVNGYPDDSMTSYFASSLIDQFYRKRTTERSLRLFGLLNSFLINKAPFIDLIERCTGRRPNPVHVENYDISVIWFAINDIEDGYGKANCINRYAHLFTAEVAQLAYQASLGMPEPYKTRALASLYPFMGMKQQEEIFNEIVQEFFDGAMEASYQLKLMFRYLKKESQTAVVNAHLDLPDVSDTEITNLVVRNAAYLEHDDAVRLAARARKFKSGYLRNRCLLKLAPHLQEGEIESLYEQFMVDFNTLPASLELLHNLYHFSAVRKDMDVNGVISQALKMIAALDDSQNEYFDQQKFGQMMFIMPHLTDQHREQAFNIANTVLRGYKKTLLARLKAHFISPRRTRDDMHAHIRY